MFAIEQFLGMVLGVVTSGVSMAASTQLADAHARIAELEAALGIGQSDASVLGVTFKLSICGARLLGCLLATPNVTSEMITLRLGIASDAKVAVHRLREALIKSEHFGLDEDVVQSQRGLGYWLSAEHKEKIRRLTSGVTSAPAEAVAA